MQRDNTLFITGANRGIGLEYVRQYAVEGWHVIACCRAPAQASALQQLAKQHSNIEICALDIADFEQIETLGDDATFAELRPVLAAYCENIVHAGPPGHGIILKLINNFIAQAICTATAEGLAAAAKSGLSIRKLHEVISAGAVNSGLFQMVAGRMLEGDLAGLKFSIANATKDLRYYTHFTEQMMLPSVVGEAVHQSLVTANALGLGEKFVPSLIEAQEKITGVAIVPRA